MLEIVNSVTEVSLESDYSEIKPGNCFEYNGDTYLKTTSEDNGKTFDVLLISTMGNNFEESVSNPLKDSTTVRKVSLTLEVKGVKYV